MSWVVEHLHRDGSVLERVTVPQLSGMPAVVRIGRALDNDVVLDDPHCAAHHAELEVSIEGSARLRDLSTKNGIVAPGNKRAAFFEIKNEEPYRLGHTNIRVRSSEWPLAPERSLSRRAAWPYALLGLALVLAYGAWNLWLKDVQEKSPPYLNDLSGIALVMCMWSGMYAFYGRLITGTERFFSHLAIASAGYLSGALILNSLEVLAFSASWLWPLRITQPVVVIVGAMTVRFHLRLADPRHWRVLRVGLVLVAALAIIVPLAQHWVSHKRLTDVQTLRAIEHPAWRLAKPVPLDEFSKSAISLKEKVDKARKGDDDDGDATGTENDYDP
ncbi:MAG: FHA domain-containing protein [Usitatibacteraceae bacterium]